MHGVKPVARPEAATVYVPPGRFLLGKVEFKGQCNNNDIVIRLDGTLVAPSDYNVIGDDGNWLMFEHVNGVSINGGTLDGQGAGLWTCKKTGKSCPSGATTLEFSNSNNIVRKGLRFQPPASSPNTDGIHVQSSSDVTIMNSRIGTGDDCVSIGPGATNLWIENVACGPGHGIRQIFIKTLVVLARIKKEAGVQNVTVKTATFTGTQNGASGVKISDVKYQDIHGTSRSEVAVKFDCSSRYPCSGISLEDVKLTYNNQPAKASCSHADGSVSGVVQPNSCLLQ
ncbi:hypothetical protein Patl1_27011 [Pistacia atlantica]|uniref:Uncharacterized protein n=1 Tax=Pistacia atlantica TaxID=434234 RepID=A0ACC1B4C6_9ROSI|nr:hypothetical protein Patl1_27011 [Pistacia atlantica]